MSPTMPLLPETDRDGALLALAVGTLAAVGVAAVTLSVGAAAATALAGAPLQLPAPHSWAAHASAVLRHPGDPGAALEPPYQVLAGHSLLYWGSTGAVFVVVTMITAALITAVWRRWGPLGAGHATRAEIRAELCLPAARRTAAWTRPSLGPNQRRRAPLGQVAAPLHRGPGRMRLCSPLENPTGTLAPTQSGKTRRDLVHKAIAAPGALLCSTTKPDLLEYVALARTRHPKPGPVLVFDTTGATAWPARLRWSPITGCDQLPTAYRRARILVEAAAVAVEHTGGAGAGNDRVFRERATFVLAAYLLAAARNQRDIGSIIRWAIAKPPDLEPVALLNRDYPELAGNLRAEIGMVARTADAVWMSVRRVVEPWLDPALRARCMPLPGEAFDAASFITARGSIFLIAGEHQAAATGPLLTAFTEHWLTTAQDLALTYPTRRLDPPATAVLDELPNATPIPHLPSIISDSAGRGVLIHWAAQSLAQLEATFGPAGARQLLDNTTTLSIWGGLKDSRALEWASTLSGHHDRRRRQTHHDGILHPAKTSTGLETVPTYRPGQIPHPQTRPGPHRAPRTASDHRHHHRRARTTGLAPTTQRH